MKASDFLKKKGDEKDDKKDSGKSNKLIDWISSKRSGKK